jgi:hypothetical protein
MSTTTDNVSIENQDAYYRICGELTLSNYDYSAGGHAVVYEDNQCLSGDQAKLNFDWPIGKGSTLDGKKLSVGTSISLFPKVIGSDSELPNIKYVVVLKAGGETVYKHTFNAADTSSVDFNLYLKLRK